MNKPLLQVHIGFPKTGTTYIQNVLKDNRKKLSHHGILYPLAGLHGSGHAGLGANYMDPEVRKALNTLNVLAVSRDALRTRDNILYEFEKLKSQPKSMVISAESLAHASQQGVEEFCKHYSSYFKIQVIVFLRRQDFMAESLRAESYAINFKSYNATTPFNKDNRNYNYLFGLNAWSEVFGSESLVIVEYPEKQPVNVLGSLTAKLFKLPKSVKLHTERARERLDRNVLEYIFNHSDLIYGTPEYFKAIKKLGKYSKQNPPKPQYRNFFSPSERSKILEVHQETNNVISSKYQIDLFTSCPPISSDELWEPYPGLSQQQTHDLDKLLSEI